MGLPRAVALVFLLVASCRHASTHDPPPTTEVAEEAPPAPRVELAPLAGEWLEPLVDDTGRGLGSVSIPTGAREPRRIAVAVHGAAGRPDFMCGAVRACIGPEAFVVCPHPVASWISEASWSSAAQIRERIEAAVDAVVSRFGPYVDRTDALYFGHSQGAINAPDALSIDYSGGTTFRYAIFFEGLPHNERAARTALVGAGVKRLLLVSGQGGWRRAHARFADSFSATPTATKHVHLEVGHFIDGRIHHLIGEEMTWLMGDRAAWALARQ